MPHIHVEYSDNIQNLDPKPLLLALNQSFLAQGYIKAIEEVKSRAICQHDFLIGDDIAQQHGYLHAKVSLLTGRSPKLQQQISQHVLSILQQHVAKQGLVSLQLCVEILEMPRDSYSKVTL